MFKITDLDYTIDEYLTFCDMKNLSKKTLKSYDQTLKLLSKYLLEYHNINSIKQIKKNHIEEYIAFSKNKGKYTFVANQNSKSINYPENRGDFETKISDCTVNNYLRNIKAFFNWCAQEKIISDNIVKSIKYLRVKRKIKDQITDFEYKKLLSCLDTTKYVEFRDYTIINVIFDSGMRLGETLALKVEDIDLIRRTAILNADITKSKKDRAVFFGRKTAALLRRWILYKDRYLETDLLFPTNRGTQLKISNFEKNFKKYINMTSIKKDITPHCLRNNFGRRFLMLGGSLTMLSHILGHSSTSVTEKAYLDLSDDDIRKNYERFSPLENLRR
ncbi:tyrosine-type recombinase/integrase [Clostridium felsineum]|uniref:tyrosine-type recombinase/integrase n=1 Tax=Clostridium felsineum TaxID=36839 RepID=UPI00098C2D48|nr:tyrosine-type recombinase/integrase [Clostridium felsineum]URZ00576.1 Tyrosine recombinase XerD [Clostridium felsineum]